MDHATQTTRFDTDPSAYSVETFEVPFFFASPICFKVKIRGHQLGGTFRTREAAQARISDAVMAERFRAHQHGAMSLPQSEIDSIIAHFDA